MRPPKLRLRAMMGQAVDRTQQRTFSVRRGGWSVERAQTARLDLLSSGQEF